MTEPGIVQCFAVAFALCLARAVPAQTRAPDGERATVQAVRVAEPLRIDGTLDESLYRNIAPNTRLIQTEPTPGAAFSEKTEFWVAYDERNIYVAWRCWESHPERVVGSELRRDSNLIATGNDNVGFAFDPFHDRRNSVVFVVGANGGRLDGQAIGERQWGPDWNPVWEAATSRFDGGWTVEAAIPFRSLRYTPGSTQPWGFMATRRSRWKNEIAYLMPVPDGTATSALMFASFYGDLAGIETPPAAKNIEIKPYVTGSLTTDHTALPRLQNNPGGDIGVDVKYGIRQNITADFTYNTDFAQVEADEQQVNLTRFSLFFPEKREFFLENQGTFAFGGAGSVGGGGGEVPVLFYSRRIGLEAGEAVPILGGGRVTGRAGPVEFGALYIRSGAGTSANVRPTDFSVVRLKRDVLGKSSVGALVTRRSETPGRAAAGVTYGVDGRFAFGQNLTVNSYWAVTDTPGVTGEATSYRAQADYNADRYGLQGERLVVGAQFTPDVGFVRRRDMAKNFAAVRFSPRPRHGAVKKYSGSVDVTDIETTAGRRETGLVNADFSIEFQNSDKLLFGATHSYELLQQPFGIAPGVTIPASAYDWTYWRAGMDFGQQRRVFGQLRVEHGEFYDGRHTTVSVRGARVALTPLLSVEPSLSVNRVGLGAGRFTSTVGGARVTYTVTPTMFASAFVQYNSTGTLLSSNLRFRWEYLPGSELFVVYNDQRDTHAAGFPELSTRSVIVKINRLLRF